MSRQQCTDNPGAIKGRNGDKVKDCQKQINQATVSQKKTERRPCPPREKAKDKSKAKSKVIILLTDGVNNTGIISPQTAAEIAQSFNIRVYTIGVGTRGYAPYPVQTPWGMRRQNMEVKIDEDLLKKVASLTGGKYFRATNNKALRNIYKEIDKMEKTRVDVSIYSRKTEEFLPFAIAAAFAFLLELLLRFLVFRNIP